MTAHSGWPNVVTPRDIAARLRIDTGRPEKTVRDFLRTRPPVPHAPYQRWEFTPADADAIVARWHTEK
jgi:hypothetical protein